MKKILLVSGCSFTTNDFRSVWHPDMECHWKKWPQLLAEMLDMDCINLAQSGAGNEFIYSTIIDQIEALDKSKIGLVIPAWSQCHRRDYQIHYSRSNKPVWRHEMFDKFGDIKYWIKKSFRLYSSFQKYCEYYKIPYKQIQMIELYKDHIRSRSQQQLMSWKDIRKEREKYDEFAKSLIYYNELKNFLGGNPKIIESLQDDLLDRKNGGTRHKGGFAISSLDSHPSEHGHISIAEYIYENL